jgi:hypothetical protein
MTAELKCPPREVTEAKKKASPLALSHQVGGGCGAAVAQG